MDGCDFFISYTRRDDTLVPLADDLHKKLTAAGHAVFLDVHIPKGKKWGPEIEDALATCKVFLVLLTEISVTREMVVEEIKRIKAREQEPTPPVILPVRVNYTADLSYQLGAYLNPIQGLNWTSDADTPALLETLTATLANPPPPPVAPPDLHVPAEAPPAQAQPSASPRPYINAGGALPADDPLFLERACDTRILNRVDYASDTLLILGARQHGKSTLTRRYLHAKQAEGSVTAALSLSELLPTQFPDYPIAMDCLVRGILHALDLPVPAAGLPEFTLPLYVRTFLEDTVFTRIDEPVVLAFDEIDRLASAEFANPFFQTFRNWSERHESPWDRVTLLFSVSTEPALLGIDPYSSPFANVAASTLLTRFTRDETIALAQHYTPAIPDTTAAQLHDLVGGHPFLTRRGLDLLRFAEIPAADLLNPAAPHQRWHDHLRSVTARLGRNPTLAEAFERIRLAAIAKPVRSVADDDLRRLRSLGLIQPCPATGHPEPSASLYRTPNWPSW